MVVVAPGDAIGPLPETGAVRTSRSVVSHGKELRSTQAGTLHTGKDSYDVQVNTGQYHPVAGDHVIGMVTGAVR